MAAAADQPDSRPNVLFIAVDDLNHWVGHLGRNPQTQTPHIDKLAARGVTFSRAYCAAPVCNPSRAALMSGLRPSTTGVYDNGEDWRPVIAPEKTLNVTFQKAGYWVGGAGKIYHGGYERRADWDEYFHPRGGTPKPTGNDGVGGIKFGAVDARDQDLADYKIADWTIDQLNRTHDKPFFLACGFHKPHMPWFVPKKWFDKFPLESIQLPPHRDGDLDDIPSAGRAFAAPEGDHARMLESGRWKEAVQAYLATIAYLDMNVGRVIEGLDKSPHKNNTIIVFWGDHGWHLGEKEHWRKFALWEESTRAPLIWVVPGLTSPNQRCERTVDFMSIFPTLCDLCTVPIPKHVEGPSLRPLLANPQSAWDRPALTTYRRGNHSVRSEGWRYIQYADRSEELYDELKDPYEWTNLAGKDEFQPVKRELSRSLPAVNAPTAERKAAQQRQQQD
jgi:arylsulfatase A-like enzyme